MGLPAGKLKRLYKIYKKNTNHTYTVAKIKDMHEKYDIEKEKARERQRKKTQNAKVIPTVQPTRPITPVQTVQPVQTIQPIQPIHTVQTVQPTQQTQTVQTVQPVQPIQTFQPIPIQPIQPTPPVQTVQDLEKIYAEHREKLRLKFDAECREETAQIEHLKLKKLSLKMQNSTKRIKTVELDTYRNNLTDIESLTGADESTDDSTDELYNNPYGRKTLNVSTMDNKPVNIHDRMISILGFDINDIMDTRRRTRTLIKNRCTNKNIPDAIPFKLNRELNNYNHTLRYVYADHLSSLNPNTAHPRVFEAFLSEISKSY